MESGREPSSVVDVPTSVERVSNIVGEVVARGSDGGGSGIMTASMLETRSKGMGGWPREVYERADIKFHDNSVMKLRVSLEQ